MKMIGTAAASAAAKYSVEVSVTEIKLAEVKPVLVQVTTRAKRRRAPNKVAAQPSRLSALQLRQARKALFIALHESYKAGSAGQQQQDLEAEQELEAESAQQRPLSPSDAVQQAREFYNIELRPRMEELYDGQYVAIHPESRSYNVQPGYGKAFRELRTQQPLGPIIVHNIGFANSGLKARLRGEQP